LDRALRKGENTQRHRECPVKDTWKNGGKEVIGDTRARTLLTPFNSAFCEIEKIQRNMWALTEVIGVRRFSKIEIENASRGKGARLRGRLLQALGKRCEWKIQRELVEPMGFEPTTFPVSPGRAQQLFDHVTIFP
jgi:hypothetical protein